MAITNTITKAMFIPLLSSELSSLPPSLKSPIVTIKNNNIIRTMYDYLANVRLWEVVVIPGVYYHIETLLTSGIRILW